jgi:hypothetical protein
VPGPAADLLQRLRPHDRAPHRRRGDVRPSRLDTGQVVGFTELRGPGRRSTVTIPGAAQNRPRHRRRQGTVLCRAWSRRPPATPPLCPTSDGDVTPESSGSTGPERAISRRLGGDRPARGRHVGVPVWTAIESLRQEGNDVHKCWWTRDYPRSREAPFPPPPTLRTGPTSTMWCPRGRSCSRPALDQPRHEPPQTSHRLPVARRMCSSWPVVKHPDPVPSMN